MDVILEKIIKDINYDELPDTWSFHNFIHFSNSKNLFDYQIDALKNTVKALYFYFEKFNDYQEDENLLGNIRRKKAFIEKYEAWNLNLEQFHIKNNKKNKNLFEIYSNYFESGNNVIESYNFINRMSYWMATGSGKSLVIIKLFAILDKLIKNREIPSNDILFLAPSNDLIDQTKALVDEYNKKPGNPFIEFIDLKEFNNYKSSNRINLGEIPVFYYRSDLLSDETKESIVDYTMYDNGGNWYVLLDEAHKGDKGDSKRQAYYTVLSRNGFLFNFSATFTDEFDIATTVKDFNLSSFVKSGYGKNLYVTSSQYTSFSEKSDSEFTDLEKQKIVIKSMIMLTYVKKNKEALTTLKKDMYHSPLMLTLVNSVSNNKSDLLMFFKELEKFATGNYHEDLFNEVKLELFDELRNNANYEFNNGKFKLNEDILSNITINDILLLVYNSDNHGSIEVITSPDNKELAFRLKSSDKTSSPFALIKIGDVTPWIKGHLKGYEFIRSVGEKKYFNDLNNHPDINMLLGSRAFYEGWDSSRPNIINYINIGSSADAKKYVMQSAGRGVRVEPLKGERKRLLNISNEGKIQSQEYNDLKLYSHALETLFIFATNKSAIKEIVAGLNDTTTTASDYKELVLDKNVQDEILLIPKYKNVNYQVLPPFKISLNSLVRLKEYLNQTSDNVLALQYFLKPSEIMKIRDLISDNNQGSILIDSNYDYRDLLLLTERLVNHIRLKEKEFEEFEQLNKEIIHFEKISVDVNHYDLVKEKVDEVKTVHTNAYTKEQLLEMYNSKKITIEQYTELLFEHVNSVPKSEVKYRDLIIKNVKEHYYSPIIYSEDEEIDYIKHIINVTSEVTFIKSLGQYITSENNKIKELDWWKFSKIDESLDNVFIPYYSENKIKKFKPDFLFWLKKGQKIKLIFVDPKGTKYTSYQEKVDGFIKLFEDKIFKYGNFNVTVDLKLYSKDTVSGLYNKYWFDEIEELFEIN